MASIKSAKPGLGPLPRRQSVRVRAGNLVTEAPLDPNNPLPWTISPAVPGVSLATWMADHADSIEERLVRHGGILFRGFSVIDAEALQHLARTLYGELLSYTYRSTPRSRVSGDIYTSTEYPADESIPMHNEMSYTRAWPRKILFCCLQPSTTGGETPIADSRAVYDAIDSAVRETFERKGVMYVRNYGDHLDLPWREVFQEDDRGAVEARCREASIAFEWLENDRLRTSQVCQAVARHPSTGDLLWFNQAHLFHISSLKPEMQRMLIDAFGEDALPRNTYYGDGSAIEPAALDEVRRAFDATSITFPWQRGDVLLLDNMSTAHGRKPFTGPRKVVVAMAEATTDIETRPAVLPS